MNKCIPSSKPAGHSSEFTAMRITFYVHLSISKCSQNENPLRQLCNDSRSVTGHKQDSFTVKGIHHWESLFLSSLGLEDWKGNR